MKPLILYHGNCPDGAGSALAAWHRFGDAAEYVAAQYDAAPPELKPGQPVFLLDFSWPRERIIAAREAGHRVVVVDHHATARERLAGLTDCTFDMEHSGAVLAWRYFHPEIEVPELLLYIEDRDLWRFVLPHSREVSAALKAQGCVNDFRKLIQILNDWRADGEDGIPRGSKRGLIAEGAAIRRCEESMVEAMTRTARVVEWEGETTAVVNASVLFSEAAEQAMIRHGAAVGAYWFKDYKRNIHQVGLRSARGGPDVSRIATRYGGGGHPHAAGFSCVELPESWR